MRRLVILALVVGCLSVSVARAGDPDAALGPSIATTNCEMAEQCGGKVAYWNILCWWDHVINWVR